MNTYETHSVSALVYLILVFDMCSQKVGFLTAQRCTVRYLFIGILLRSLDTEANRFYDRNHQMYDAALLTRCYTQHTLRPFIDSESNHIRSFIKIPFINKGIDFIDLPSIFQDKSVIQSIPTYFQNSEPPIICYKYNKPIRNTIFNFNKLVSDLDIHANTPKS